MQIESYPNCCTAKIFTHLAWHALPNKTALLNELKACKRNGIAIVSVAITNKQTEAYTRLKSIGFKFTRLVKKTHHPENKLRLGWFLLEELQ